jgi:hypothetical protein
MDSLTLKGGCSHPQTFTHMHEGPPLYPSAAGVYTSAEETAAQPGPAVDTPSRVPSSGPEVCPTPTAVRGTQLPFWKGQNEEGAS